jgi:RES domain-containing protein
VSVALWRIAAVTLKYTADDLSGAGAKASGGRWNSVGMAVVYCSESIALALHETVVHLRTGGLPLNRYLVRIEVPDDLWQARQALASAPVGWDARPHGSPSVLAGDSWLKSRSSALLTVPSVIVPEERNVLINPDHPGSARISAAMVRRWEYDPRLF